MKVYYIFIFFILFFSCGDNTKKSCVVKVNEKPLEDRYTHKTPNFLPNQDKYNYFPLKDNVKDTIYLGRKISYEALNNGNPKNKKEVENSVKEKLLNIKKYRSDYTIIKIKNTNKYEVLDSISIPDFLNEKIDRISLSPHSSKIAVLYSKKEESDNFRNNSRILRVFSANGKDVLYKKEFSYFIETYVNLWSFDDNQLVFYNRDNEIFTLNLDTKTIHNTGYKGTHAMWIKPMNAIAYLDTKNTIQLSNLDTKETTEILHLSDGLFFKSYFSKYYWVPNEKRFYIFSRYRGKRFYISQTYEENIIKYSCE